jgi:hypothetical protein
MKKYEYYQKQNMSYICLLAISTIYYITDVQYYCSGIGYKSIVSLINAYIVRLQKVTLKDSKLFPRLC